MARLHIPNHLLPIAKRFQEIQRKTNRSMYDVFFDVVQMWAIALAGADPVGHDEREARFERLMKLYDTPDEALGMKTTIAQLMGMVILKVRATGEDVLGQLFHAFELHNKWTGQFFTPWALASMLAQINLPPGMKDLVEQKGFVSCYDPATGSGVLPLAGIDAMEKAGLDPRTQMHWLCIDIDPRCIWMTFVQLNALDVPAVLIRANALQRDAASEEVWYTRAHLLNGWDERLTRAGNLRPPAGANLSAAEQVWADTPARKRVALVRQAGASMSDVLNAYPPPAVVALLEEELARSKEAAD